MNEGERTTDSLALVIQNSGRTAELKKEARVVGTKKIYSNRGDNDGAIICHYSIFLVIIVSSWKL